MRLICKTKSEPRGCTNLIYTTWCSGIPFPGVWGCYPLQRWDISWKWSKLHANHFKSLSIWLGKVYFCFSIFFLPSANFITEKVAFPRKKKKTKRTHNNKMITHVDRIPIFIYSKEKKWFKKNLIFLSFRKNHAAINQFEQTETSLFRVKNNSSIWRIVLRACTTLDGI